MPFGKRTGKTSLGAGRQNVKSPAGATGIHHRFAENQGHLAVAFNSLDN
jgi:hypothetical protein